MAAEAVPLKSVISDPVWCRFWCIQAKGVELMTPLPYLCDPRLRVYGFTLPRYE